MEYGFLSVIPPLVTIVLALVLKNVFVSLLIGLFLSSFILTDFNLFAGLNGTFYGLVDTFTSSGNTIVLMSMLLIGALIYMIERTGGISGFVDTGDLAVAAGVLDLIIAVSLEDFLHGEAGILGSYLIDPVLGYLVD